MPLPLLPIVGGFLATGSLAAIRYLLPFILIQGAKILGLSLITFTAFDYLSDEISTYLLNSFSNLGVDILAILKMGGFLDSINIILAGWAAQLQLKATLGAFNKIRLTPSV